MAPVAWLFAGQLISQVCDKMTTVGLVWVLGTGGDSRWVPGFLAVSTLPHLLMSVHAGFWVARLGPGRAAVLADLARAAIYGLLALANADSASFLPSLAVATFAAGVAGALFNPAILSLPARVAPPDRLPQATALVDSSFQLAGVLGPLAAGVFYEWAGLRALLLLNSASYLVGALATAMARRAAPPEETPDATGNALAGRPEPAAQGGKLARIREILARRPEVRGLLLCFLGMNLFLGPSAALVPAYASQVFGGGIGTFAGLESAMGIGMVAASLALAAKTPPGSFRTRISISIAGLSVAFLGFALSRSGFPGAASLMILGAFAAAANVFILTFFQSRSDTRETPIIMSLVNLISVASLPLSMAVMSLAMPRFPVPEIALVCALGALVLAGFPPWILSNRLARRRR